MKYRILALAVVLLVGGGAIAFTISVEPSATPPVAIEDIKDIAPLAPVSESDTQSDTALAAAAFRYEIADTNEARRRGLSGRESVPQDYGLLFVFPWAGRHGFWMKDMLVPIDIIWLSDTGEILSIDSSVEPATYPREFFPPRPVRLVLETAAGEATRQGWSVGTVLQLPLQFE